MKILHFFRHFQKTISIKINWKIRAVEVINVFSHLGKKNPPVAVQRSFNESDSLRVIVFIIAIHLQTGQLNKILECKTPALGIGISEIEQILPWKMSPCFYWFLKKSISQFQKFNVTNPLKIKTTYNFKTIDKALTSQVITSGNFESQCKTSVFPHPVIPSMATTRLCSFMVRDEM